MYARNRILPGASADCTLQCYRYSTEFAVIFRMKISCTAYYNAMKWYTVRQKRKAKVGESEVPKKRD